MVNLKPGQLRRWARLGAVARLEEIREETAAIRAEFPELFGRGRRDEQDDVSTGSRRRRRRMSPAERNAVSARMRRYWAMRRKGRAGK